MNISPETEWLPGKSVHNIMRNILTSSIRLRTLQVPDPILQADREAEDTCCALGGARSVIDTEWMTFRNKGSSRQCRSSFSKRARTSELEL